MHAILWLKETPSHMVMRTLALLLLAAFVQGSAYAQNNVIRGKVRDPSGVTLNNAIVELRLSGGAILGQTVTRNDGDFAFNGLTSAEYEIAVSLAGYQSRVEGVRFNHHSRGTFQEVLTVEIKLNALRDAPPPAAPGTNFVQDVPREARAAYERGLNHLKQGRLDHGAAEMRSAINLFGEYFDAHLALGEALYRSSKDKEALESLEAARRINDRNPVLYHLFGMVMLRQQKWVVAEWAFSESSKLNPSNPVSHLFLARALIESAIRDESPSERDRRLNEAEQALELALELSSGRLADVYLQRARIHERRGEPERAAQDLEAYLKAQPRAANASAVREAIKKLRQP